MTPPTPRLDHYIPHWAHYNFTLVSHVYGDALLGPSDFSGIIIRTLLCETP
jgi:hypothetical protein